jgi:hypothetical protein
MVLFVNAILKKTLLVDQKWGFFESFCSTKGWFIQKRLIQRLNQSSSKRTFNVQCCCDAWGVAVVYCEILSHMRCPRFCCCSCCYAAGATNLVGVGGGLGTILLRGDDVNGDNEKGYGYCFALARS